MENIFRDINEDLTREEILMLSPLELAYIGDGVYELYIRTFILDKGMDVNKLHKLGTSYARAEAQAEVVHKHWDFFTEKEQSLIKRGRNTKVKTSPKHANIIDYKYATGFETMLGYLYLLREYDRLDQIIRKVLIEEE